MTYLRQGLGLVSIPAINTDYVTQQWIKKIAADKGISYAEAEKQWQQSHAEAAARQAAAAPTPVCPKGTIYNDMGGRELVCSPDGFAKTVLGYPRAITFAGRQTTVAKECHRAGTPFENMLACAKKDPAPHKMRGLKNLGDPYKEYAAWLQLDNVIRAAGVPETLVKEVANKYKERVKMLNGYGGTRQAIIKKLGSAVGGPGAALALLAWYEQPFNKRVNDIAVLYKSKIQKVTAAEAAEAARQEQIQEFVAGEKRKKLLLYGGAGLAAIGIGFLFT